jgi:hypothetical protein
LESLFPDAARELDQYQEKLGRDLKNTGALCIQVKRHASLSRGQIKTALIEAGNSCDEVYITPMVFYREDHKQWRVCLLLADLLLLNDIGPNGEDNYLHIDMCANEFLDWLSIDQQSWRD